MSRTVTTARIYCVPFTRDYKDTIYFPDRVTQEQYFQGLSANTYQNLSFVRKDGVIHIPDHFDDIYFYNYLVYEQEGKKVYCFIKEMKYINDERTDVYIETDVMQTYMNQYSVLPSYVEREHVRDDTVGKHLIDEGLETGEYICNLTNDMLSGATSMYVVLGLSKVKADKWTLSTGGFYNNLFSGLIYRAFPYTEKGIEQLNGLLRFYDEEGHGEDIISMFLAPSTLITLATTPEGVHSSDNFGGWVMQDKKAMRWFVNYIPEYYYERIPGENGMPDHVVGETPDEIITFTNAQVNNYAPRNKKLLTFPYKYLLVSNNNGTSIPYRYEMFETSDGTNGMKIPTFMIEGALCPGGSVRLIPTFYKGATINDMEGINLGKFPALSWTSDMYTNWMTQNSVNIGVDVAIGAASVAVGLAGAAAAPVTGGTSLALTAMAAGSAIGGVGTVVKSLASMHNAAMLPGQSKGNTNNGDVIAITGRNCFIAYDMSIKEEFARIIDSFFDMYGYKVNSVKVPEKNHRQHWWYTKTIDVNIEGNIPMEDKMIIMRCYNNGITFWREGAFGRYDLPNAII